MKAAFYLSVLVCSLAVSVFAAPAVKSVPPSVKSASPSVAPSVSPRFCIVKGGDSGVCTGKDKMGACICESMFTRRLKLDNLLPKSDNSKDPKRKAIYSNKTNQGMKATSAKDTKRNFLGAIGSLLMKGIKHGTKKIVSHAIKDEHHRRDLNGIDKPNIVTAEPPHAGVPKLGTHTGV
ncbi:hypothetical protein BDB01DRAFT_901166 [Pilobolus umbonatus]|nr:hypothetical protein BDB01DRAFT_901166 [Pilobolus umbonatus]